MTRTLLGLFIVVVAFAFVACGGDGHEGHTAGSDDADHAREGTVPGEPADPSDAATTIEVKALDQLRFDPATIDVSSGDVVTFVVTNEGDTDHEFVLGDASYQEAHGGDMEHDMSMGNAISVAPGETEELTWRFTGAGEVLYGCHEAGHYDGGMVGTIEVT